jgi:hypothetical protein
MDPAVKPRGDEKGASGDKKKAPRVTPAMFPSDREML